MTGNVYLCVVEIGDPLGDCEAETAALDFASRRVSTVEAIEDVGKVSF